MPFSGLRLSKWLIRGRRTVHPNHAPLQRSTNRRSCRFGAFAVRLSLDRPGGGSCDRSISKLAAGLSNLGEIARPGR